MAILAKSWENTLLTWLEIRSLRLEVTAADYHGASSNRLRVAANLVMWSLLPRMGRCNWTSDRNAWQRHDSRSPDWGMPGSPGEGLRFDTRLEDIRAPGYLSGTAEEGAGNPDLGKQGVSTVYIGQIQCCRRWEGGRRKTGVWWRKKTMAKDHFTVRMKRRPSRTTLGATLAADRRPAHPAILITRSEGASVEAIFEASVWRCLYRIQYSSRRIVSLNHLHIHLALPPDTAPAKAFSPACMSLTRLRSAWSVRSMRTYTRRHGGPRLESRSSRLFWGSGEISSVIAIRTFPQGFLHSTRSNVPATRRCGSRGPLPLPVKALERNEEVSSGEWQWGGQAWVVTRTLQLPRNLRVHTLYCKCARVWLD